MAKADWHHLYRTKAWHRLRTIQLRDNPLCCLCRAIGRITAARIADHIKAHKGDEVLFFDPANLQSLCKTCHDSAKQKLERTGVLPGCGLDGVPLDRAHHWN